MSMTLKLISAFRSLLFNLWPCRISLSVRSSLLNCYPDSEGYSLALFKAVCAEAGYLVTQQLSAEHSVGENERKIEYEKGNFFDFHSILQKILYGISDRAF